MLIRKFPKTPEPKLNFDEDCLRALGEIGILWATFETLFNCHLVDLEYQYHKKILKRKGKEFNLEAMETQSFKKRKALYKKLLPHKYNAREIRFLVDLIDAAQELKNYRDKLFHGVWFIDPIKKNMEIHGVQIYRKTQLTISTMSLKTLQKIKKEMGQLLTLHLDFSLDGTIPSPKKSHRRKSKPHR